MTTRQRISDLLLIVALLMGAVMLGGTVYQMLVINPAWGGDLPGSLPRFFQGSQWPAAFARFWAHPVLSMYPLFLIGALTALWPDRRRRAWLLATLGLVVVVAVWTGVYFIPAIDVLFVRAGAGLTPAQITAQAGAWLFWDRIRFVLITAAWLTALEAYGAPRSPG